jgi:hypothetical protein
MMTQGIHCRLLALTYGDFDGVARAAQQFGRPTTDFQRTPSIVAWKELVSFESGDWSWASGIPETKLELRIAVFHLGTLPAHFGGSASPVGIFGIASGFPSLSDATRNYILRAFSTNRLSLIANLSGIITDGSIQSELVGYSYASDGILYNISSLTPGNIQKAAATPKYDSTLHSVRLQVATAIVEIRETGDLLLTAEAGDPDYAIEDSRRVFDLIIPHLIAR